MNKKIVKIISFVVCVLFLVCFINNISFATTGKDLVSTFDGKNGVSTDKGVTILQTVLGSVLSVIRIVAVGVAIIMITFLGIKYMSAAPSEKANIKNQLIAFGVGSVLVFGAASILGVIKRLADSVAG